MDNVYKLGSRIEMKKAHPCGSLVMLVIRLGADIKIECEQCKHRIMLPRHEFDQKIKKILD